MKFKLSLYLIVVFIVLLPNCTKEPMDIENQNPSEAIFIPTNDYDKSISEVALAIHQSQADGQFMKTLKQDIMQRPDGDYEVILKSFLSRNSDLSKSLLSASLAPGGSKGDEQSVIEKYPKLQISIPVHAEKWDGISKLWVLYLPSDFDEFSTKEVPAISPDGKHTMFNIEKQPDFPVIVISQNERSNANGDLKFAYNKLREKVKFNLLKMNSKTGEGFSSFSATPVTNAMAVALSWTFSLPYELEPYDHYFEIYRDDFLGGGFQKIAEEYSYSTFYYDSNVLSTRTYAYYVVAKVDIYQTYNHDEYVTYYYSSSDEAALPAIPTFTSNFTVDCIGPSVMELRWTINNISNWTNLQIKRYDDYNTTPVVIADLPITSIYYQDILSNASPAYGVTYTYILRVFNSNTQEQQEYYCQEMLSNRISNQLLKVTRIQFNTFDDMRRYEGWVNGAPEIMLSVFKVINNSPQTITSNVEIGGPASSGFDVNYPICQWPKTDANAYTISLNEYDGGESSGLQVNLAVTAKTPKILGTEVSITFGVQGTLFKRNRDEYIGSGYLYYWNNANGKNVYCGNYCYATLLSVPE